MLASRANASWPHGNSRGRNLPFFEVIGHKFDGVFIKHNNVVPRGVVLWARDGEWISKIGLAGGGLLGGQIGADAADTGELGKVGT